jgi:uroporphyrinogen decarboxylase
MERKSEHCAFWPGNPHIGLLKKLFAYYGVDNSLDLDIKMGAPVHWVQPEALGCWTRTDYPQFDPLNKKDFPDDESLKSTSNLLQIQNPNAKHGPVFADVDDVSIIDAYHWPTADDCDFTETLKEIERTKKAGLAVMCSMWGSIFSNTWNFFGMDECLARMYESPETVQAVTRHLTDFYLAANEKLFNLAGDSIDCTFIGIDLGSQLDLLISPEFNDRFTLPYIREQIEQAHKHGYFAGMHSCGSIYRIIPRIINMGVDVLHPIQALARGMSADELKQYNGRIVFMGGVDTQELLPNGNPDDVRKEVKRLVGIFGPNYIVSSSHEAPPENIPTENYVAMAAAAQ